MTQVTATSSILQKLPRVDNSPQSPCWQQEQIAKQNAYLATVATGKEVVYRADCKAKAEPKTS